MLHSYWITPLDTTAGQCLLLTPNNYSNGQSNNMQQGPDEKVGQVF